LINIFYNKIQVIAPAFAFFNKQDAISKIYFETTLSGGSQILRI
jgi:hypothetical protein